MSSVYFSPPNFLFSSLKELFSPCCAGTYMSLTMVAGPELPFFADTEKPVFTGEITGNIFILGNFCGMHGGPEKTFSDSEAGEYRGQHLVR